MITIVTIYKHIENHVVAVVPFISINRICFHNSRVSYIKCNEFYCNAHHSIYPIIGSYILYITLHKTFYIENSIKQKYVQHQFIGLQK